MFDSELIPQLSDREIEALAVAEAATWDDVASDRQMIPDRLDEWSPGPFLVAVLSSIDSSRLNGHDTVVLMKTHARQVAHDQAGYYSSVAEVATAVATGEDGPPERTEEWFEYASVEVRGALTLTRRAADSELDFAYDLVERLPSVLKALDSGTIDLRKAREIARGTGHLDQGSAMAVADRVLRDAARLTTGQLRVRLQRLCIESNPEDARQRSENAIDDRRLIMESTVDGTADFLCLPGVSHAGNPMRYRPHHTLVSRRRNQCRKQCTPLPIRPCRPAQGGMGLRETRRWTTPMD